MPAIQHINTAMAAGSSAKLVVMEPGAQPLGFDDFVGEVPSFTLTFEVGATLKPENVTTFKDHDGVETHIYIGVPFIAEANIAEARVPAVMDILMGGDGTVTDNTTHVAVTVGQTRTPKRWTAFLYHEVDGLKSGYIGNHVTFSMTDEMPQLKSGEVGAKVKIMFNQVGSAPAATYVQEKAAVV